MSDSWWIWWFKLKYWKTYLLYICTSCVYVFFSNIIKLNLFILLYKAQYEVQRKDKYFPYIEKYYCIFKYLKKEIILEIENVFYTYLLKRTFYLFKLFNRNWIYPFLFKLNISEISSQKKILFQIYSRVGKIKKKFVTPSGLDF